MEEHVKLTTYVDSFTLQELQDTFSHVARMFATIIGTYDDFQTEPSNMTEFCSKVFNSEKGKNMCINCSRCQVDSFIKTREHEPFLCPAGIYEFSYPILLNQEIIGIFIGGQVLDKPLEENNIRIFAREYDLDEDELWEAAKKLDVIPFAAIKRNSEFAFSLASCISSMIFRSFMSDKLSREAKEGEKAKSDFLANMSHEIRTPMNAVLGMANMAMKENLPGKARNYISQIISSGKLLLAIINDILDYSKIESGKMEFIEEEYNPHSLINDISNIISSRLSEKPVDLIIDINPELPTKIMGDSIRIKQIIVNLANNAAKFTNQGKVALHIDFKNLSEEIIELKVAVEDTGIGIKEDDLKKLFKSFQQVDSKRNRSKEGTGLGLAISKNFVELMGGEISVTSEYGKGSEFKFSIPQKIASTDPCVEKMEMQVCGSIIGSHYILEQIEKDIKRLGHKFINLDLITNPNQIKEENIKWVFIEQAFFSDTLQNFFKANTDITPVIITSIGAETNYALSNIRIIQKPVHSFTIAAVLSGNEYVFLSESEANENLMFTAPDANILIVDDNDVNLTVTKGLLEPLNMNLDTAMSGKECLSKITANKYDLIFMDHMMPEMDGVETTLHIRKEHPDYEKIPIIALTANVIQETRSIFFQSGMNDFVAKPIESKTIIRKLKAWLPADKIKNSDVGILNQNRSRIIIEGLDTQYALSLLGSEELFYKVLTNYWTDLEKKITLIDQYKKKNKIKLYTIEVHALKSSSRQIGALELSKMAEDLEKAGNREDIEIINRDTDAMLNLAKKYLQILEPYCKKEEKKSEEEKPRATSRNIISFFNKFQNALDNLDLTEAEEAVNELDSFAVPEEFMPMMISIKNSIDEMDTETALQTLELWKSMVKTGLLSRAEEIRNR